MHVSYTEPLSDLRRILVFMEAVLEASDFLLPDTILQQKKKDLSFRGTCETQCDPEQRFLRSSSAFLPS